MKIHSRLLTLSGIPVKRPWLSLGFVLLLTVALFPGLQRLRFSNDIRIFFSDDNPQLKAYEDIEATYAKSNSVLFVLVPEDGNVFTRDTLAAIEYLTNEAWKLPYSRRVDSLANYQNSYAEGDDLIVEELYSGAENLSDEAIADIRQTALNDPLLLNRLIASDASVTGINVPVSLPGDNPMHEQPEIALAARELALRVEQQYPHHEVRLTGIVMVNQALIEEAAKDLETLVPFVLLFVGVTLGLLLRQWAGSLVALVVIIVANIWAFAVAGWIGIVLSPPVVSAFNMIMTLAVADTVHLLVSFNYYRAHGRERREAMRESLLINAAPVFFTTITTFIGFLSLNASDSPPFRDLGNIVAIGVIAAWVLVHTILPALMVLLPSKPAPKSRSQKSKARAVAAADFVYRFRYALLGSGMSLTAVFLFFALQNDLNDEFLEYFHESVPFRQDTEYTIEHLTGFEFIEFSLDSGEPGGVANPEFLSKVESFVDWLEQHPKVKHVYSLTYIMKRLNLNMHADAPEYYRIPESRELAAQNLLLFEMSLPFGQDLTDIINVDRSATLIRASLDKITSNEMIALDKAAQTWLTDNELSIGSEGTGQSIMFAYIGVRNIKSLMTGTIGALLLVSFMMIFVARSLKFGLSSIIPNLSPAAIAFGVWYFLDGRIGLAVSVVIGMTFGVVVDDSIHFLTKYLYYRREAKNTQLVALQQTYVSVGGAMIASTITLVGGFGILALSNFELNQSMGFLSAVTIAIALFFDLLIFPPLLLIIDRDNEPVPKTTG